MQPLFWCQQEVRNNLNGHPVYVGLFLPILRPLFFRNMTKGKHITKKRHYLSEYLAGAAFSAKDFLSQQMNQGGSGGGEEEGEGKVAKKEE